MKKLAPIAVSTIIIGTPLVASLTEKNFEKDVSVLSFPVEDYNFNENLLNGDIDMEPKGVIGNVTYYGKRQGSKEIIDIYLDSQTLIKEDKCFLMVSVYDSDGNLEYRLDTTIIYFKVATHYKIELDPPKKENEKYREVRIAATFYSNPENRNQFLIFDINYNDPVTSIYENDVIYTPSQPVATIHKLEGDVEKIYENFEFSNICDLSFRTPIFDIKKMNFTYQYKNLEILLPYYNECYLLIDKIYDSSDLEEENEMKKIPLNLVHRNGIIFFELMNQYYYDSSDGMIYQNYLSGRSAVDNLILPSTFSTEEAVYYELHLKDFGAGGDELIFKSYATFDIKWFGICGESFFCVKSMDNLLEDVYYSGGIII